MNVVSFNTTTTMDLRALQVLDEYPSSTYVDSVKWTD